MHAPLRRREFFKASSAAAVGIALPEAPAAAQGVAKSPENFRLVGAPVLQGVSESSAAIVWAVNDTSTGWVEYGTTEALGQKAQAGDCGLMALDPIVHKVRLTGLAPATKYFYRVYAAPIAFLGPYDIRRGRPFASPIYSFTTLDAGRGAETTFSVINDTHETKETLTPLLGRLKAEPTAMTFWNGDMFDDIRSESHLAEQLLVPAGLVYATESPVYFTRGNHDVRGAGARHLSKFVDTPNGLPYYSFRQGPVAFICLDTGEDKPDDHPVYAGLSDFAAYRLEQRGWLAKELARDHIRTASFRVVVAHIPMYEAAGRTRQRPVDPYGGTGVGGGADARAKWHDLLVKAGIDLIIAGHTHRYAFLEADATRPFAQLTGGGPRPEAATLIQGRATTNELVVMMTKLDGTSIGRYTFNRRT